MITQEEIDQWDLPSWAKCRINGSYETFRAALSTRDGRAMGNAVNAGIRNYSLEDGPTYIVITDAGTLLHLIKREMEFYFYPPEFIMKEFLPAQQKALQNYDGKQTNPG